MFFFVSDVPESASQNIKSKLTPLLYLLPLFIPLFPRWSAGYGPYYSQDNNNLGHESKRTLF